MKFCWKYHVSYQYQWVRDQIWTVHVRPGRGGDASAPPKCHGFSWKHQVVRVNPLFRIVEPTHTPCPLSSVGVACIIYIYSASALLLPVLDTRLVLLYNYILDYGIDPNTQHHPSMSSASVRPPWLWFIKQHRLRVNNPCVRLCWHQWGKIPARLVSSMLCFPFVVVVFCWFRCVFLSFFCLFFFSCVSALVCGYYMYDEYIINTILYIAYSFYLLF